MARFSIWCVTLLALFSHPTCSHAEEESSDADVYHDYCVVGAGPAGLQMAFFLGKAKRDYVVYERESEVGSFFAKYPRHRKLISINKRHTGKTNCEFNLRHDWNSLLSDDDSLRVARYTHDFFPSADTYVDYLRDYAAKLGLKVQFNTAVKDIHKAENVSSDSGFVFKMNDQHGKKYVCGTLIIGNGVSVPARPEFRGSTLIEHYDEMSVDPSDYEGQSVLVLGHGNSAFEVADSIGGATNFVHMIARSRIRLAWATHYVGDLRAVNNNLLDTYQLKSLDGIADGVNVEELAVTRDGDRLRVVIADKHGNDVTTDNYALREPYDRVINCLGFKYDFSLFNGSLGVQRGSGARAKYPAIGDNYEATTVPGLFFVGANTHSLDFRRSAGGFIHGFRYTARTLHRILERRNHGDAWPAYSLRVTEIVAAILRRVNEASDLYQMFGVLADVIMLRDNKRRADYVEAFPINLLPEFAAISGIEAGPVIVIVLEYGKNFSGEGKDPFHSQRATGSYSHAHLSNFLHPVLYYYDALPTAADMASKPIGWLLPRPRLLHHVVEDFLTDWTALSSHVAPLRHFVDDALQVDTRWRFTDECFALRLTHASLPYACEEFYMAGRGLVPTTKHQRHLASQEYALSE